jgi:hypothetical protein
MSYVKVICQTRNALSPRNLETNPFLRPREHRGARISGWIELRGSRAGQMLLSVFRSVDCTIRTPRTNQWTKTVRSSVRSFVRPCVR